MTYTHSDAYMAKHIQYSYTILSQDSTSVADAGFQRPLDLEDKVSKRRHQVSLSHALID